MTGMIVRMFKETPRVMSVSIFPKGEFRWEGNPVEADAPEFIVSQLLTIRHFELKGWKLWPSRNWEEAES